MPEALPPELEQRLRAALLRCGPFDSDSSLRAVFVDARIAAWRDDIPDNTPSRGKRVAAFIEGLLEQHDNAGNNALALVLHVLADRTPPGIPVTVSWRNWPMPCKMLWLQLPVQRRWPHR